MVNFLKRALIWWLAACLLGNPLLAIAASTFANHGAQWYVRTDGNELRGGCFDPSVASAGTNFSDQAPAHVTVDNSTITASSAGTTLTFASGYTPAAADIGNCFRLASGTSCTADYYMVTGANAGAFTWTLDRTAGAACTAIVGQMGGAHISLASYSTASSGGAATPALASPLVAGNIVWLRGDGTNDPSSATYTWSGVWTFPNCDYVTSVSTANGPCKLIGYNGYPQINHNGHLGIGDGWSWQRIKFFRASNTGATLVWTGAGTTAVQGGTIIDSIVDQNGFDSNEFDLAYGGAIQTEWRNSGGGAAGTHAVLSHSHPSQSVIGNWAHDLRGDFYGPANAVSSTDFAFNVCARLGRDCVRANAASAGYVHAFYNNTCDSVGGSCFNFPTKSLSAVTLFNNLITNSAFGITFADSIQTNIQFQKHYVGKNVFFGNGANNFSGGATPTWFLQQDDLTCDPGYVNAAGNDYRVNGANCAIGAGLGLNNATTASVVNIGAMQNASGGGGGGSSDGSLLLRGVGR